MIAFKLFCAVIVVLSLFVFLLVILVNIPDFIVFFERRYRCTYLRMEKFTKEITMKTIDEVIHDLQEDIDDDMNCEYSSNWIVAKYDVEDAISYLKELKEERERKYQMIADAYKAIEAEKERISEAVAYNPPLTWEELGTMEGKPVWVEEYDPIDDNKGWRRARWNLIQWANSEDNVIYFVNDEWDQTVYHLSDYGKTWTAYRKERR